MKNPIYIDVTELARNPIRTGIQRVVRQLLRQWPTTAGLVPCVFDASARGLVVLPPATREWLLDESERVHQSPAQVAAAIAAVVDSAAKITVPLDQATIFVPEVFFDSLRSKFYNWLCSHSPERVYVLAYDFIPWLYPDLIGVERAGHLMYYIQTLLAVQNIAFISAKTRDDYINRIVRDPSRTGPVINLGADAIVLERQNFDHARRLFLCLGSIDGRKNQHLILRAFQELWAENVDAELVLVGRIFDESSDIALEIAASTGQPRFRHIPSVTDDELAFLMRSARAAIYVSSVEGYGLPPVESLMVGIPVIGTQAIPSLQSLPSKGQIRLEEPIPAAIAAAVLRVMNENEASRLWREAAELALPTWQQTAEEVARWIQGGPSAAWTRPLA